MARWCRIPRYLRAAVGVALASVVVAGAWALEPKEAATDLDGKEFFKPELYISTAHAPIEEVLAALPNGAAWESLQLAREEAGQEPAEAFVDPRSATLTNLIGEFPILPGRGVGNAVTLEELSATLGRPVEAVDAEAVADAVRAFVGARRDVLALDVEQLGAARAVEVDSDYWQVRIPQTYGGVPVRHGHLVATIKYGNLLVVGTEAWGNVRGLSTLPALDADGALAAGFGYAGGASALDEMMRPPALEIVPVAPPEHQVGEAFGGPIGAGYRHRLVWSFVFRRPPDDATWEVLVDAHDGEVLAFQDINQYAQQSITGGVYPLTSTGVCPTPQTCGTMQSDSPMPFADTGLAPPRDFTNGGGIFDWTSGTTTTTLTGRYVDVVDTCGVLSNSSSSGSISLGGSNDQHDCTSGGGSAGNTPASRTAFYELNKLAEQARGWLPTNGWLQSRLTANVNLNGACNASWNGTAVNFLHADGGCRNTGEIAAVFDHEWGHGLDDNDAGGELSLSSEAYADIAAIYRLQTSCVGHGFYWTRDKGCGMSADGTGFNQNEDQVGGLHCDLDCSGVRDADWDKHSDHTPDTALGFVCSSCAPSNGPCGRQVHCAAAPVRQAAWDLVARDLQQAPFGLDGQTAFLVGNKLFYQGSGNIGLWHACTCGSSASGCGATNGYMQWLTADDDNGSLKDGTPHMTAIFNAFKRHGIACSQPKAKNSGCAGGPTAAPNLSVTAGDYQVSLSWSAVPGATSYWVFRSEGHAGCDFGKAKIGETTGLSFTDTQVAGGRDYDYNVVAAGSSPACYGRASNCVNVKPTQPPPTSPCTASTTCSNGQTIQCSGLYTCETEPGCFVGCDGVYVGCTSPCP